MTLEREHHRPVLRRVATSGDGCFLIGPDTAPHLSDAKKAARGCAGVGEVWP
jgi:dihydroorotase